MMKKRWNRKGFTLAEVLIVVAIIVVLAGVGFVALFSHMRTMHQLEVDGHAKEIFVAAQNHLTLADSQGYLGKTEGFGEDDTVDPDKDIFYFLVGGEDGADPNTKGSILNQMLPFGSVDESARNGGSYIIRYQKSTATVLDVFYVSTSGRFGLEEGDSLDYTEAMKLTGDGNKKARRDNNPVLGWYGGAEAAALLKGEPLIAPGLQVLNGDKLEVIVTDNNVGAGAEQDGYQLNLIITGASAQTVIALSGEESTYTVTLDDVTSAEGHFVSLGDGDFTPGENIDIKAVAFNNEMITNIAESSAVTTNSLFEDVEGGVAKIGYLRHLINLDESISRLGVSITKAEQTADLSWTDFKTNVKQDAPSICPPSGGGTPSAAGYFLPVDISSLEYDGKNFKISDIAVSYNGDAGLFGTVSNCTVQDLELVDFTIKTTGSTAGALAGSVTGTSTISGVLVHNSGLDGTDSDKQISVTEGAGAAGGLVGKMTGGKVESSAAAVYVYAKSGPAGGLIGETASGTVVVRSYSGGHTQNAKYVKTNNNVISDSGSAGGLIGVASGGSVNACYSTCSAASPNATANTVGVGGLIGEAANVGINHCYSVGLVDATGSSATVRAFVARVSGTTAATDDCAFLSGISDSAATVTTLSNVTGETPSTTDSIFKLTGSAGASVAYDRVLTLTYKGEYPLPTADMLAALLTGDTSSSKAGITNVHVGDWQLPSLTDLDYVLKNNDPVTMPTLYTQIKLESTTQYITLALQGETSKNVRLFVLQVVRNASNIVTGVTVKSESGVDNADSSKNWQRNNTTESPNTCTALPIALPATGSATPTITVTLDSITDAGGHFAQLFAADDTDAKLIPGENFTLYVRGGEGVWEEAKNLKREEEEAAADKFGVFNPYAKVDNSLFAFAFTKAKGGAYISGTTLASMSDAQIEYPRHLQNLDTSTSSVGTNVTKACLIADIDWSAFSGYSIYKNDTTTATGTKTAAGNFNGIYNAALTEFNGNDGTNPENHKISNLKIGNTFGDGAGNAGFFRTVPASQDLTVKHLWLENISYTSDPTYNNGAAGGIVGVNETKDTGKKLTLQSVLVSDKTRTDAPAGTGVVAAGKNGVAGGLVGLSSGDLTIDNSSASVYVTSGSSGQTSAAGAAGGMVGRQDGGAVKIFASYVGGHTVGEEYYDILDTPNAGASGRWNVIAYNGAAGGLIGETTGGTTGIEKSFNAASVYSGAGNLAGGIIGRANSTLSGISDLGLEGGSDSGFTPINGVFDLVYTVAPVANVRKLNYDDVHSQIDENEANATGSANAGGVFGTSSSSASAAKLFYLVDVYKDARYADNFTVSNIKYIGTGSVTNVLLASYFAGEHSINYAIIGRGNVEELQDKTTTYDNLHGKEFPFTIWTKLSFEEVNKIHFYGDWQPIDERGNHRFTFYFLKEDPTTDSEEAPLEPFEGSMARTTMDILMVPFLGADLATPSIPFIPGYLYGTESDPNLVWSIYYGDHHTATSESAISSASTLAMTAGGTSDIIGLTEKMLKDVMELDNSFTLIAHYYDPGTQYTLKLMDKDPSVAGDEYKSFGTIQVIAATEANPVTIGEAFSNNTIRIPRCNRSGYRFMGWYTGENGSGKQIFSLDNSGNPVLVTGNDFEVSANVTLYSYYKQSQPGEVKLVFKLKGSDEKFAEQVVEFDKSVGLNVDVTLPGINMKGEKVTEFWSADSQEQDPPLYITYEFLPENGSVHTKVHLESTEIRTEYPAEYDVYVEGQVAQIAYAVVHKLEDTASDDLTYSADDTYTYQIEYKLTAENVFPSVAKSEELDITGFQTVSKVDYQYSTTNNYGITTTQTTANGKPAVTVDGSLYELRYVWVVSYEREEYSLSFVNPGDRYLPPVDVPYGAPISGTINGSDGLLRDSYYTVTMEGNTFNGWEYTDEDDQITRITNVATQTVAMPAHDLSIEAKWLGADVNYKVMVWVESANTETWDYIDSKEFLAQSGSTVTVDVDGTGITVNKQDGTKDEILLSEMSKTNKLKKYIHVSTKRESDETAEIESNGTTIINVYYDRDVYRLRFDIGFAIKTSNSGSYDTYVEMTEAEAASYTGMVYGEVGGSYVALTKNGDGWLRSNPSGDYYGYEGGLYVLLEERSITKNRSKPEFKYTEITLTGNETEEMELYGYDEATGNYIELEAVPHETTEEHGEAYVLLNGSIENGNKYLIVSVNSAGDGFALGRNGTAVTAVPVEVISPSTSGGLPYILASKVESTAVWTTVQSTMYTTSSYFKNGNEYLKGKNGNGFGNVDTQTTYASFNWDNSTKRLQNTYSKTYIYYSGGFQLKNQSNSVYLYVESDEATTTVTTYSYKVKKTDAPYDGPYYTKETNTDDVVYLNEDTTHLVQHTDEEGVERLHVYDIEGRFGKAGAYIPAVDADPLVETKYYYNEEEYTGQKYRFTAYDGSLYKKETTGGTWNYYVSSITNSNNGNGDTWDDFLTQHREDLGTTNPFVLDEYYTGYYETTVGSGSSQKDVRIYYYDIVGKYGKDIMVEYPGSQPARTNGSNTYLFVGWLGQRDSYYNGRTATSIKGFIGSMEEDLILTGGTIPGYNSTISGINPDNYQDITINDQNTVIGGDQGIGVTQEFHCRYTTLSNSKKYLYKVYLKDPDTDQYPTQPTRKTVVTGGSGSYPNLQTAPTYQGYVLDTKTLFDKDGKSTTIGGSSTYNPYTITELTAAGVGTGMNMEFKLKPKEWTITLNYSYYDTNGNLKIEKIETQSCNYGKNITDIADTEFTILPSYTFSGEWYDNPECSSDSDPILKRGDAEYNGTLRMPDANLVLYAKVTHNDVNVKFTGDGVSDSFSWAFGTTLKNKVYETVDGQTKLKAAYTPQRADVGNTKYIFVGWYYMDGTKKVYLQPSLKIVKSVEFLPEWTTQIQPSTQTVTIHYYKVDFNNNILYNQDNTPQKVKEDDTAEWRTAAGGVVLNHTEGDGAVQIRGGDFVSMDAPDQSGYTRVDYSVPLKVSDAENASNEIVFRYQSNSWQYKVEYYVEYSNITAASWVDSSTYDSSAAKYQEHLEGKDINVLAQTQYELVGVTMPTGDDLGWLSKYRFDHFNYNNEDTSDNYITIHPDTGTVVKIVLSPDPEEVFIDDIFTYYDGEPANDYDYYSDHTSAPVLGPGITKDDVKVHYTYCKPDGSLISNTELQTQLVNAGVYGVRAYVTVKADNGLEYLVWQSAGDVNSPPPLHLYVQRRFVILRSKSADNNSSYWDSAEELLKCEVLYQAIDPNKATDEDEVDVLRYWYAWVGVYDTENNAFTDYSGFVGNEGVTPIWSANAFRRDKGTSKNMFSYEFKDGTDKDNYNIYVMYGDLSVN